eukprot:TRINITY_DN10084_c0_g1_i2.p1 TRINITY_DN10084_c0_g1~~TRINITY_DN10084_c0_g1_i2.p1  ORF type:complete len:459 (-),score=42.11 TRINITY_DN10084_c0_g1_i2:72-1448(-)
MGFARLMDALAWHGWLSKVKPGSTDEGQTTSPRENSFTSSSTSNGEPGVPPVSYARNTGTIRRKPTGGGNMLSKVTAFFGEEGEGQRSGEESYAVFRSTFGLQNEKLLREYASVLEVTQPAEKLPVYAIPTSATSSQPSVTSGGMGTVFLSQNYVCFVSNGQHETGMLQKIPLSHIAIIEKKRTGLWGACLTIETLEDQLVYTFTRVSNIDEFYDVISGLFDHCLAEHRVFALPINEILEREERMHLGVPRLVKDLTDHIRQHGLDQAGIFRISPNHSRIELLINKINRGSTVNYDKEDIHTIAGLLKRYLRDIPEPIIPHDCYEDYSQLYATTKEKTVLVSRLKELMEGVPAYRQKFVLYLCEFVVDVAAFAAHNKMTETNIALIFSPILIGAHNLPSEQILQDSDVMYSIMMSLMQERDEIFAVVKGSHDLLVYTAPTPTTGPHETKAEGSVTEIG